MQPPLAPRDLTIPDDGSRTARDVFSRSIQSLVRDVRRLPSQLRSVPGAMDTADALDRLVRGVLDGSAERAGALFAALRRPTVAGLFRCLRNGVRDRADADDVRALASEALATLAMELGYVGVLADAIDVRPAPRRVVARGARLSWHPPPETSSVRITGTGLAWVVGGQQGSVTFDDLRAGHGGGGTIRRPFHTVRGDIVLALDDNNPLAMFEAHPDKHGNAIDLGERSADEWCGVLGECLDLIERFLPTLRGEIDLLIQQFVPVGFDREKHLSASYQEAIGTIYLSLHPNVMTMTEAVIHEFSHNKINALFELDDVLVNAFHPLYPSPVRPDPRPLHGVLLAVHAFLPVARLYERMRADGHALSQNPEFERRFAAIRALNDEAAKTVLTHGQPTPAGRPVLDEIDRWNRHFLALDTTT